MTWTDTHAHIYAKEFDADRSDIITRAQESGIGRIYMPNVDHTSIDAMLEAEARFPGQAIAMMGLHPCSVNKDFERELYLVEEWLGKRKFAAVGEIGTDLYWDKTWWEQQQEAFRIQVTWAKKYQLPLVIHCRNSMDETLALLAPLVDESLTGVFHCFTGTTDQAKKIMEMGFFLGIGGVSTFKNGGLDTVLPEIGMDQLVLETDSPYLAPVPHRGKRNEPSYIALIAGKVASLLHTTDAKLMEATDQNVSRLFAMP